MNFQFPPGATLIDPDEAEGLIPALSTQDELNEFEALNILEAMQWARRRYLDSLYAADRHDLQPLLEFVRS